MRTSKVVIEISIEKRLPKSVLEKMVVHFSGLRDSLLAPFRKYDEGIKCRVYYDDYAGAPQVSFLELLRGKGVKRHAEKIK